MSRELQERGTSVRRNTEVKTAGHDLPPTSMDPGLGVSSRHWEKGEPCCFAGRYQALWENAMLLGILGSPVLLWLLFSRWVMSNSFCNPMDCGPPGSSVRGISQVRVLEWVPTSLLPSPSAKQCHAPGRDPTACTSEDEDDEERELWC